MTMELGNGVGTGTSPTPARDPGVQTIERTLAILEIIAERGGASAREVSTALGFPLPTVYRLMQALVQSDYLVHLRAEHRFELGFKLDRLRSGPKLLVFTIRPMPPRISLCTAERMSSSPMSSTPPPIPGSRR